jgi:hypothetical protein
MPEKHISMKVAAILKFLFVAVMFTSCGSDSGQRYDGKLVQNPQSLSPDPSSPMPAIQFDKTEHDFGRVLSGEKISFSFRFKNTGKSDLLITKVSASCGCTVPVYPRTPIAPGAEEFISVTFNTQGRKGFQQKSIVVLANTNPNSTTLTLKAEVYQPDSSH